MKLGKKLLAWMLCAALLSGTAVAVPEGEPEEGDLPTAMETLSAEAPEMPAEEPEQEAETPAEEQEVPAEEPSLRKQWEAQAAELGRVDLERPEIQPAGDLPLDAGNPARRVVTELPKADFVEDRLLVKLERRVSLLGDEDPFEGIARSVDHVLALEESGGDMVLAGAEESAAADWYRLELKRGLGMLEAWNRLLTVDGVLWVEPDYLMHADAAKEVTAYDPMLHAQSWLDQINAPAAWAAGADGDSVVVAVVDSGVDLDHPDLQGRLLEGYDFVEDDRRPDDADGHGTHVAGIVAAERNDIGVRGVAPKAKILPVRVLDENGSGSTSDIANAIAWAAGAAIEGVDSVKTRANVINLSLGGFNQSQLRQNAIDFARSKGCLVVACAGNEYLPTTYAGDNFYGAAAQPAGSPGVLTVMAMNETAADNGDWLADFSNYDADPGTGAEYEIMAPGVNILSTYMDGGYGYMNGTSMACPIAAGAAAALMSLGCSADEVWELLVGTGEVRQGKTQPDGTVRSYPALDLGAAAAAKKSGSTDYRYAPEVANAELELALTIDDVGHGEVDFGGINTSSWVYYLEGEVVSSLAVTFENLGGTGDVRITGTVGGEEIVPVDRALQAGGVETVELTVNGVPESRGGYVTFELYANGEEILREKQLAVELKTLDQSGKFRLRSGVYRPIASTAEEDGLIMVEGDTERTTVWVLDRPVEMGENAVMIRQAHGQEGIILYQGREDAVIKTTAEGESTVLYLVNAVALGAKNFVIQGGGLIYLYYCIVYDPLIEWATYLIETTFQSAGTKSEVTAYWTHLCSFTDFRGLVVDSTYYERNLMNHCSYSSVVVNYYAGWNTFVENYAYDDPDSILWVFAPDAGWSGGDRIGLWYSSFVGPADFYWLEDGDPTEYLALVRNVYLQEADDPDLTFEQTWYYDSQSTVSSSVSQLNSWGFGVQSPVFVTDTEVEYEYDSTYGSVDYTLTYTLSAPISADCDPYVDSYADTMTPNARVDVGGSRKTVTVELTAMMTDPEMVNDYSLAGIWTETYDDISEDTTYDFWATELVGQICSAPIALQSMRLETVEAELQADGTILVTWDDERIQSDDGFMISRAVDGGAAGPYAESNERYIEDPWVEPGHAYTYTVTLYRNGREGYYGTAEAVYPKATFHGGEDLTASVSGDAVTVGLDSPWMAGGEGVLTCTLPAAAAAEIEFSQQVRESGLCYGAVDNGDGTVTVTIGLPEESAVLHKGGLFTLTPESGANCRMEGDDLICLKGGVLQLWHLAEEKALAAGYAAGGRMTDVEIADAWGEVYTLKSAGNWKLIFPDANWLPVRQALEF